MGTKDKMKQTASRTTTVHDSNTVEYLNGKHPSEALVIKQYRHKPLNTKMVKYTLLRLLGFEVPIEYLPPLQRRNFESECIQLWHTKGFNAPSIKTVPTQSRPKLPHIGLGVVDGTRLDHLLADKNISTNDKFEFITNTYKEMRQRHCIALFEQNHRLIHYDANLRNFIIAKGAPVHIDFEMGHLNEDINTSAAREVKKFTLQVMNALERENADQVIQLLMRHYNITGIILRMIQEEFERPFINWHLKRDRRKKQKKPQLITKIDVAQQLKAYLYSKHDQKMQNPQSNDLIQALETSWDGKFYQSLDDSDPRGRDMGHRYAVMGVPDSYESGSVLDIGCNIGRICMDAKARGAAKAVGIDFRKDVIDAMNRYYKQHQIDISLFQFDINQGALALESLIGSEPFEYVFALSIWSHVDQDKLWDIINRFCSKVCFFEDHAPSRVKSLDQLQSILEKKLDFNSVTFMGFTTDRGVRAVFRLEK